MRIVVLRPTNGELKLRFRYKIIVILLCLVLVMQACVTPVPSAYRTGKRFASVGDWDSAVVEYTQAVALDPSNIEYQLALRRAKSNASKQHVQKAKAYHRAGQLKLAAVEYKQAFNLDPLNQLALDEYSKLIKQFEEAEKTDTSNLSLEEMKLAAQDDSPVPMLDPRSDIPIRIKFDERESEEIFQAIAKPAGINVLFDESFRSSKISVDLADVTFLKALYILNLQTKTFYKVLDEYTIIIIPDNRQKRQEYEDQVIRTFYLSNADVKEVFQNLRVIIDSRKMAMSEQLNSITIRDSPDKVAVAGKVIEANDKAKGEVVVDVELLEINWSNAMAFGPSLSNGWTFSQSVNPTLNQGSAEGTFMGLNNLPLLKKESSWLLGIPSISYELMKGVSNAKTIAKPQLRVTEGEKATIHIGDNVPIRSATYNVNNVNGGTTESYTYQKIGIQIEIEPRVHHNQEVTLKLKVEVSSITAEGVQPTIGTRNIETVIRLQDGQVNLLAGLIKDEERDSLTGPLGLSEVPILKRLVSSTRKQKTKTDIVLSLTPHIIRMPNITAEDLKPLWVGTEDNMRLMEKKDPPVLTGQAIDQESPSKTGVTPLADTNEVISKDKMGQTFKPEEKKEKNQLPAKTENTPVSVKKEEINSSQSVLSLFPSSVMATNEGEYKVQINIKDIPDMNTAKLVLTYDPKVIEITSIKEGSFPASDGKDVSVLKSIDNKKGRVNVSIARIGVTVGVSGSGQLLELSFKALSAGKTVIGLSGSNIVDTGGKTVSVVLSGGEVTVK